MKTIRIISLAAVVATTAGCWWERASCSVEFGYARGEMPNLDMRVGDTVDYFNIPRCIQVGSIEARSGDPAAVAVSLSGDARTLTTAAVSVADSVRVTVTALSFPNGSHEFFVWVRPPSAGR